MSDTGFVSGHVIVTGGASGIGEATVLALIDDGASVTILDVDDESVIRAEERHQGEDVLVLSCDITDEDEVAEAIARAVGVFGPVTGLVNCAGIARDIPAEKTSIEAFRQIVDVNLTGTFIICKAALEQMGDSLAIVNLASVSGLRANSGRAAYGASKAGVVMLSQVLANEWGASGVRVNVVAPGPIDSPLVQKLHTPDDRKTWTNRTPLGRYGRATEVARAIRFLLSDEASYVNGHVMTVDGGFTSSGIIAGR